MIFNFCSFEVFYMRKNLKNLKPIIQEQQKKMIVIKFFHLGRIGLWFISQESMKELIYKLRYNYFLAPRMKMGANAECT